MTKTVETFSFWLALTLSLGSLLFYLLGAFWNRILSREDDDHSFGFNLAVPDIGRSENLFSIALVSAGTTISTVVLFFFTTGASYGWWLLICPVMFAIGHWFMLKIYERIRGLGYFNESSHFRRGAAGLIPYLGERLTGSRRVGWLLALLSLINLIAVLVLELTVGVDIYGHLTSKAFGIQISSAGEFSMFAASVLLLLGYVFIGGFRAVISSDVWQMKAIRWAILITFGSLVYKLSQSGSTWGMDALDSRVPWPVLCGFALHVVLANLFAPLSQEASWQRFRAFSSRKTDFRKAVYLSMASAISLWVGLIAIGFALQMLTGGPLAADTMSGALEVLRTLDGSWFPLFVFPVLTVAALSAMYSTADTSVSSILYLLEYQRTDRQSPPEKGLPLSYYLAMLFILGISLGVFGFVRLWFNLTIFQLVVCAFSNLIVIAPTIITASLLLPVETDEPSSPRAFYVLASLGTGFVAYWTCSGIAIAQGTDSGLLSLLAIVFGLLGAALPLLPLWTNSRIVHLESEVA